MILRQHQFELKLRVKLTVSGPRNSCPESSKSSMRTRRSPSGKLLEKLAGQSR
uniref:Uncharacterized protein n=1 Tax=Lepeophtheirus salmonis TaxID=72036 RepID=A0A0K2TQU4_LEPSM